MFFSFKIILNISRALFIIIENGTKHITLPMHKHLDCVFEHMPIEAIRISLYKKKEEFYPFMKNDSAYENT